MSSSQGTVVDLQTRLPLGYFRYDGTSDVVVPAVFATQEELRAAWRNEPDKWGDCEHPKQDVLLHSSYGGGFSWPGKWCPQCMAVDSPLMPFDGEGVEITNDQGTLPYLPDTQPGSNSETSTLRPPEELQ